MPVVWDDIFGRMSLLGGYPWRSLSAAATVSTLGLLTVVFSSHCRFNNRFQTSPYPLLLESL
jgi:hypothetical protein